MRLFLIIFVLTYLLSACGHKGPLYIPLPQTDETNRALPKEMNKK
ncbi:MAG: lipoprotein [Nitrosomonas sp.]|nr:lipoprotein [Nitrosomonas sp.]MBP7112433.1 lipoprotein [Nitrosomonas sp.]